MDANTHIMADKLQSSPPLSLPDIFVRYLKATTDEARQAVVQDHPQVFPPPVVDALSDARRQLNETMREVREACRMIDAVSGGLEYTGAPVELQPIEAKALLDEDTLLQNFATSLAGLLEVREKNGKALPSPALPAASGPAAVLESCASGVLNAAPAKATNAAWFEQPALVLAVLSFLSAEEIFMEAENVCRNWRGWLFEPEVSRFFWVGCVQREFPQQLAVLLQTEGEDLFQSDWRSLAMLCVAEDDGDGEGGEGEEEHDSAAAATAAAADATKL